MAEHIHHHLDHDAGDASGANALLVLVVLIAMFAVGALLFFYAANGRFFPASSTPARIDVDLNGATPPAATPPAMTPQNP